MKKAVRVYLTGTVQGVFFRDFVKKNADELGLRGFVRNLDDGRVELFLEGESDKINQMIELCRQGPKFAHIKNVEVKEEKFQYFKDFRIITF